MTNKIHKLVYVRSNITGDLMGLKVLLKRPTSDILTQEERDESVNEIVRLLGFKNEQEYFNVLPGERWVDSRIYAKIYGRSGIKNDWCLFMSWIYRCDDVALSSLIHDFNSMFESNDQITLLKAPTVNEMLSIKEFKNTANHWLWFCSDWCEENG